MKTLFTRSLPDTFPSRWSESLSRVVKREASVWQRRYMEHTIRDDDDFKTHLDYIHYNPVNHGYVSRPVDWPWSSFHTWVQKGEYGQAWGTSDVRPDLMERNANRTGE